jgi:hypothetical protein
MAIDNRIQYKFRSDRGTYYRLTIIDTLSSTSTLYNDVFANDDGFKLTYETNNDDRFTGLMKMYPITLTHLIHLIDIYITHLRLTLILRIIGVVLIDL